MDIDLAYREAGSGTPFLLLHGNGEDSSYFSHQLAHFQDRYRVIAVDTRGHGRSPRGSAPFTLTQFADDLYEFMAAHALTDAVLLGFSDGANIAMTFALRHGDMLKALILNGGNLDPRGVKRATQLPIELGYRVARCFAARSPEASAHAELLGLMVNEPHLDPRALAAITVPTLVVAGTRDMIREAHTRKIAASIPNARLAILEGDHFIANKRSVAFDRAVDNFLETL